MKFQRIEKLDVGKYMDSVILTEKQSVLTQEIIDTVIEDCKEMYEQKHSEYHGWEHIKRTLDFATYIAKREFPESLYDIILAVLFHDIGRVREDREDEHGEASAKLFLEYISEHTISCDVDSICFAIHYHSIYYGPDGKSDPILDNYPDSVLESINTNIVKGLWDADRLDLIRADENRIIPLQILQTTTAKEFANSKAHKAYYDTCLLN